MNAGSLRCQPNLEQGNGYDSLLQNHPYVVAAADWQPAHSLAQQQRAGEKETYWRDAAGSWEEGSASPLDGV